MRWQDEGESEENTPLLVFQYTMGFEEKVCNDSLLQLYTIITLI